MTYRAKLLTIFVISILTFSALFYCFANYLDSKVNESVQQLAEKLTAKVGQTVKINSVTTKWSGLNLKIDIKDLVVLDNKTQTPLLMVNHIVSTVDGLKSFVTLSVKYKHLLVQSPRLAVQWDGISPPKILGLADNNFSSDFKVTEFLQLLALQHNVSIIDGDIHIQGLNDADIPLMDVTLEIREKALLDFMVLLRGSVAVANPTEFNAAVHYLGNITELSKYMLDFEINTSNLQVDNLLNLIPKYKQNFIQGAFEDLNIKGAIQDGELRFANTEFAIEQLDAGAYLSLTGGNGKIFYKPAEDHIGFTAANIYIKEYDNPKYSVTIQELSADVKSVLQNDELEITSDNLNIKFLDMELKSKTSARFNVDKVTACKLTTEFHNASVPKVLSLLPASLMGPGVTNWLQKSLIAGDMKSVTVDYNSERIYAKTEVTNTELKYSPAWPSIHSIDAAIVLQDKKLLVLTERASILDTKINHVTTEFLPIKDKAFVLLKVNGDINAALQTGLEFLQQTPLRAKLADKLAVFKPTGDLHLDLGLAIDLSASNIATKIKGVLDVKNGTMQVPETKLSMTDIVGRVNFTNNDLLAQNVHLKLASHAATAQLALNAHTNNELQIKLASRIDVPTLQESFPDFNASFITGATAFAARIDIPWDAAGANKVFSITSDLQGIAINLPAPLHKTAATKMPLSLRYEIKSAQDKTVYIKLSNWLDANLLITNGEIKGGQIALNSGKATINANKNLLLSGKIASLDWDTWSAWLDANKKSKTGKLDLDVFINDLKFRDTKYQNISIKYDANTNTYKLDSPIINGEINISKETDKIAVQLERLNLSELTSKDDKNKDNKVIKVLQEKNKQKQLPIIQFYCENLVLSKQHYRKVSVQLLPRTYGYEIIDLSISNDNILLQAQGQWQMENSEYTQVSGNIYTKNIGQVVKDLNFGKSLSKGNGEFNFSLQWSGDPTQFSLAKLNGNSHIELQNGMIDGVNPGVGRLIGLLNLESIQRRLNLDFSDLNSKGLAFDTLTSDLTFKSGVVSTDKMTINCPSARIELNGNSNLDTHTLDFEMFVSPKVGVGLPLAAAIAVANPIVGAVVWGFDQVSGSKISEMTRYKYKATGTWENPKIEEITAQHNAKSNDPTTKK